MMQQTDRTNANASQPPAAHIQDGDGTDQTGHTVRTASVAMLLALLILAVMNSKALVRYVGNFSASPIAEEVILMVEEWDALMDRTSLSEPHRVIREHMEEFRALRFEE